MSDRAPIRVEVRHSIADVSRSEWDACTDDGLLSSTHRWQVAFERDERIGKPIYFLAWSGRELLAVAVGQEFRFPLATFMRGGSIPQTLALLPPFMPVLSMPTALFLMPLMSYSRPGLFLRAGVDPEDVGALMKQAMYERPVSIVVTTGLPDSPESEVRELSRLAIGGYAFPWLEYGFYPGVEPKKYFETFNSKSRARMRQNEQAAEKIGLKFEVEPDLNAASEDLGALVKENHQHLRSEDHVVLGAQLERPEFYRHLQKRLNGSVEAYRIRDGNGAVIGAAVGLLGKRSAMVTYWGMHYPAPPRVSLYNLMLSNTYRRLAPKREMHIGPDMHRAKVLALATMVPTVARVAATNPAWDRVLRGLVAPWFFPSLDVDDWDAYKIWPRWFLRVQALAAEKIAPILKRKKTVSDPYGTDTSP